VSSQIGVGFTSFSLRFFDSPDRPINGSPDLRGVPPPWVIPDWRGFGQCHPSPSQTGVDFSDQASIGVGYGQGFWFQITQLPNYPFTQSCPQDRGRWQIFRASIFKELYGESTLGCRRSIAIFFAHSNGERGHVLCGPLPTQVHVLGTRWAVHPPNGPNNNRQLLRNVGRLR
jgi:hypothetical protein